MIATELAKSAHALGHSKEPLEEIELMRALVQ